LTVLRCCHTIHTCNSSSTVEQTIHNCPDIGSTPICCTKGRDMKRVQAEFPYSDYWLYIVWHQKEGRWQANLVKQSDTKERTTISYARYKLSVYLGRLLDSRTEHVDHIDNDKTNDSISNLQILTPDENKKKQEQTQAQLKPRMMELNCSFCGKIFMYRASNYKFYLSRGRTKFNCSKQCASDSLKRNK
jgi:hypothetical protein